MQKNEKKSERKYKEVLPIYTNYGNIVMINIEHKERKSKMKKKYGIVRRIAALPPEQIDELCTLDQAESFPVVLEFLDDEDKALERLKDYETDILRMDMRGTKYMFTEFLVEELIYDKKRGWIPGGDVLGFTPYKNDIRNEGKRQAIYKAEHFWQEGAE